MGMIKITLEDKEYQRLVEEIANLNIKEMIDQKWYTKEIEEVEIKRKARFDWLKANCL